ncbi:unnamed protein product [Phytophthora lilii]|uniref:Dol-P-Glc:Glc(2)Man(9)GlcNAc(2)-PP-Dol alpha-1,2-glucosyltransferase n=1 Tax=Phytophthora lilii TaxID=2077276 RepID=A0A9W6TUG5_9STRA|nr:unnamed protein product [Phytophthora lilii]
MATSSSGDGAVLPRSQASVLPITAALALLLSCILVAVNHVVPEPYMDEIFHVPQAQKYCQGRFGALRPIPMGWIAVLSSGYCGADEWDPKITTFPGLYLVSTLYAKTVATLGWGDFCSTAVLRSVNVLFAVGNVVLCVLLRCHVAPQDPNALLHGLRTAVFPPLFFFAFLFYTDGGATFFVLLMLLLAERVDLLQLPPARGSFMLSAMVSCKRGVEVCWYF